MDTKIIFYSAVKTSMCERTLKKCFPNLGFNFGDTSFAIDSVGLGKLLCGALEGCNTVFVIGGLGFEDMRNTAEIISRAVSSDKIDDAKRLKASEDARGYLLRSGRQIIVLMPDNPGLIEEIARGPLTKYIGAN